MHSVLLVAAAFLASAVEMVEALTIVLAVGVARGWRSAGWGVAAAVGGLVVIVAGLGPALANLPIDSLRLVVGTVLSVALAFVADLSLAGAQRLVTPWSRGRATT